MQSAEDNKPEEEQHALLNEQQQSTNQPGALIDLLSAEEHKLRGDECCKKGEVVQAFDEYSAAIRLKPEFAEVYILRGDLIQQLDSPQAFLDYSKVIELQPENFGAYYARGSVLMNVGEKQKALQDFDKALELRPDYTEAHNSKGIVLLNMRQLDLALEAFNKALQVNPNHYASIVNRANCYGAMGNFEKAFSEYQRAIETGLNPTEVYYYRACLYASKGDSQQALKDFGKCIQLSPLLTQSYLQRSKIYQELNQPDLALADLNKVAELEPEEANWFFVRGQFFESIGQPMSALKEYCITIQLEPTHRAAYLKRGNICELLGQHKLAFLDFSNAIQLNPVDAEAYFYRGLLLQNMGQLQAALHDRKKVVELRPTLADAHVNLGTILQKLGLVEQAIISYSKAIELDPNSALGYCNRGSQYYRMGQVIKALEDLNKAIELDPTMAVAYNNRGSLYDDIRQFGLALADLNKTLELSPGYGSAYYNRGVIYENMGKQELALQDYTKTLQILPKYVQAVIKRARLYSLRKQHDKALQDLNTAVRLRPGSFFLLITRSLVYWEIGFEECKYLDDLLNAKQLLDQNKLQDASSPELIASMKQSLDSILKVVEQGKQTMFNKARQSAKKTFATWTKLFLFVSLKRLEAMQQKNFKDMKKEHETFETLSKAYQQSFETLEATDRSARIVESFLKETKSQLDSCYRRFVKELEESETVRAIHINNRAQHTYTLHLAKLLYIQCIGFEFLFSAHIQKNRFYKDGQSKSVIDILFVVEDMPKMGPYPQRLLTEVSKLVNEPNATSREFKQILGIFVGASITGNCQMNSTIISAVAVLATSSIKRKEIELLMSKSQQLSKGVTEDREQSSTIEGSVERDVLKELRSKSLGEEQLMRVLAMRDLVTFVKRIFSSKGRRTLNQIILEDLPRQSLKFQRPEVPLETVFVKNTSSQSRDPIYLNHNLTLTADTVEVHWKFFKVEEYQYKIQSSSSGNWLAFFKESVILKEGIDEGSVWSVTWETNGKASGWLIAYTLGEECLSSVEGQIVLTKFNKNDHNYDQLWTFEAFDQ